MSSFRLLPQFFSPPNWFTAASIFCGFYSVVLSLGADGSDARFYQAGLLVGFAGTFDMLDGAVARFTNRQSEFGMQLDSMADVVSFGIAPAALLYAACLVELGVIGLAGAFFFVIAGIFRLARFNLGSAEESDFSRGLTITMGGGMVAACVMLASWLHLPLRDWAWGVLLVLVGAALLMVSNVPYRGVKASKGMKVFAVGSFALGLLMAVLVDVSVFVAPVMLGYALLGPVRALFVRR